jgi:hypothetical protein
MSSSVWNGPVLENADLPRRMRQFLHRPQVMTDPSTLQTTPELTLDSIIARAEDQFSTVVDGEIVLMNVSNGKYFQLNNIGSRVWSLIETPTAAGALCDQLVQEFDVARLTCEADVLALLGRLLANNLVRIAPAA